MATNKKVQKSTAQTEKILLYAGLSIVILACVSSIFYAYTNQRFINELFPSAIYYLNHLVVIGGGFLAGYIATKSKSGNNHSRLFSAVCYAFLAASLFYLYELLRVFIQDTVGDFDYPAGRYVFELGPLVTLIVTGVLAFIFQSGKKDSHFSASATWTLIISFVGYQIYNFTQATYSLITQPESYNFSGTPVWLLVVSFIVHPLVITGISYLALSYVKLRFNRILYAVFIGSFSSWTATLLWSFRTDPSNESTFIFSIFVGLITLVATALLILKTRSAAKIK